MKSYLGLACFLFFLKSYSQELPKCDSETTENQENALTNSNLPVTSPLSSEILSNSRSHSSVPDRFLRTCYYLCKSCSNPYFDGCTSCQSGYILFNSMCIEVCPTAYYLSTKGECNYMGGLDVSYFTFNGIKGYFDFWVTGLSMICGNSPIKFYPDYDENDPYPTNTSGYYFDPSKSMMQMPPNSYSTKELSLDYHHSIIMWLWRRSDTAFNVDYLLRKVDHYGDDQLYLSISRTSMVYWFTINGKVGDIYTDDHMTAEYTLLSDPTASWNAYAITFSYSSGDYTVTFYENGAPTPITVGNGNGWSFQWHRDSSFIFGYNSTYKSGFDGWLGELGMFNSVLSNDDVTNLYSSSCSGCSLCPVSLGTCFSDCGYSSFYDGSSCQACLSTCTHPCVASDKCWLCNDWCWFADSYCTGFGSGDCSHFSCNTNCKTCSGGDSYTCLSCKTNTYLYKGFCLSTCPGNSTEQPVNQGDPCGTSAGYYFKLDSLYGGSFVDSNGIYYLSPINDPFLSYRRGVYFNGVNSYLANELRPLRFDIEQTHAFWVKTTTDNDQTILTKVSGRSDFTADLQIWLKNLYVYIWIRISDGSSDTGMADQKVSDIRVTNNTWTHIYYIIKVTKGYTYHMSCISSTCTDYKLINTKGYNLDSLTSVYYGFNSYNQNEYFQGFIWDIRYDPSAWDSYQRNLYAYSNSASCAGSGGCTLCIYDGECLADCAWNYYYDDSSTACAACLSSCQYGCKNSQDCNVCTVTACETCKDLTSSTCEKCYSGTAWNSSTKTCDCINGKAWDPILYICGDPCFTSCSSCTAEVIDQCTTCKSGYYSYNSNFCVKNCPFGYSISGSSCLVNTQGLIVNFKFTKTANTQYDSVYGYSIYMGTIDDYYPNYDSSDPWVLPYRGLYFKSSIYAILSVPSGAAVTKIALGLDHTISIWTLVDASTSSGLIFGLYNANGNIMDVTAVQYNSTHFSYKVEYWTASLDAKTKAFLSVQSSYYAYSTWQQVVVTYHYANQESFLEIFINAKSDGSASSPNYIYYDYDDYTASLGSSTSGFVGYVYSLKLYNYVMYSVSTWTSSCGYPYCTENNDKLINCQPLEYYDESAQACKSCSSSCNVGCRNGKDCDLCAVTACESCQDVFSSTCDKCYDGTAINSAKTSCDCSSGKVWDSTTYTCIDNPCYTSCSACRTLGIIDQCTACNSGYYFYNNFCVKNCPIGYSYSSSSCVANNQGSLIINFEFTRTTNTQYDSVNSYSIYMGTADDYYPNYDSSDPWVLPYRGLYFTSVSSALLHVPSSSQATQITLGLNHTISIWTMIDASTSNGLIFGLYNANNVFMGLSAEQYNSTHFSYKVAYWTASLDAKNTAFLYVQSSYYAYSTWQQVVITYSYGNQESILKVFINTKLDDSASVLDYVYYDYDDYTVSLGASTSGFVGYLYSLKLYNCVIQSVSTWTSSCGYPYCTENNDKLILCNQFEYYDETSKTCKSCHNSCTVGCRREGNICNLNEDPLCDTYSDLKPSGCTQCKADSTSGPPCACNTGYMYDSTTETCICMTGYQYINGKCVACYRYLQPSEISGYFTSTFARVVVDLAISVNTTDLTCEKVFTSDTIAKFGSGYVCYFDSMAKEITIDLGDGFTLTNELIKIIDGALFGLELKCGYFPYSLDTTLTYSAPLQYPTAKIDAPSTVLYNCQNLTISGKKSTGSIKSSLYYKWSITSEPNLSLSKYNTDFQQTISEFTILNSELSTATITVTLTVKNKLNNENTVSLTINSIPDGFAVNFDNTIDYQFAAPDWQTYAIGSISSCDTYNNLSLKWKLAKVDGNFSAVNEDAIWGNQTKVAVLNIPNKALWPFTNATFSVAAEDSTLNIEGSGSFEVLIIPNPPIIEFSRTNGSADISSSLFINANSSYDPNEDKNLFYEWSCTQASSSCSSFISDTKSENLTISENTLQSGKEYEFKLSALADFSSRRQLRDDRFLADKSSEIKEVITINTVDYAIPTVNIMNPLTQSQPVIITGNTMVLFQATIEGGSETQFSYQWSVDNSATIRFSTPLTQLFLAIVEGTLEARHSYTLTLTVSENSKSSYFTYQFYVNSPPYSGNLAVTPSSGIELETVFKMEALGWVDDENNLPLSYSFGYWRGSGDNFLNFKNQSLTYFSTFPYLGDTLTLFVDVYDNLGAYSTKNASITISINKKLDQKELYSNYKTYINSVATNTQTYPGVISALCDSILNRDYWLNGKFKVPSSANLAFYYEVIESALSWTEDLINTSQFDSQSISIFSALLSNIVLNPYLNSSSTEKKVCDMIISIFNKIPGDLMLQKEQPYKYFLTTNEAFLYNSSSLVTEKEELNNAIEAINSIEKLVLSQMVLSESRNLTANDIGITMVVIALSDMNEYKLVSSNGNASITFPSDFSSKIANITDEKVLNLALSVLDCPNSPNNLSSSVVDFTMYGHSSNEKINVNLTDSNILVQIPVWNVKYSNYTPECVFLDIKTMNWSKEGCTKYKINSYDIICSCNHFTSFAALNAVSSAIVDSNIGDTVNAAAWGKINSSNAIGLYFCIITLIIYGIFAILAYMKDRKDEKEEEQRRRKLMGDPKKLEKITTNLANEFDYVDETIKYREKKSCWPCKNNDDEIDYNNSEKSFSVPEVVFVYSFADQENSENSTEEDDKYLEIKKWIHYTKKKHELLNIMFIREPERPSFSRITLFFLALLGQMFFIGMFYKDAHPSNEEIVTSDSTNTSDSYSNSTNSTNSSSSDSSVSYSWTDFWIMVRSSLFMIIITVILNKMLREKLINDKMTEVQFREIRKQNKIKRWIGVILVWGIMFYFCWSIALYAIQFKESISKTWVLNTGVSYTVNIFVTSLIKATAIAFVTMKVTDWYERYKIRKYRENNELDSDEVTEETPTTASEKKSMR